MKKLLVTLAMITLLLFSCSDAEEMVKIDPSKYRVVRSDTSQKAVTNAAVALKKAICEFCEIPIATDYEPETQFEILVGSTNRESSQDSDLRFQDFRIFVDSDKIFILGGSDEAVGKAVDYFMENFIDEKSKMLVLPTDGYSRIVEAHFDSLSAFGVDLGDYSIRNESMLSTDEVSDFAHKLAVLGAKKLPDTNGFGKNLLILDGTSLIADEYSVTFSDGKITITGSRDSLPKAMEELLVRLSARDEKLCDLNASDSFTGSTREREIYSKEKLMSTLEAISSSDQIMIGEEVDVGGAKKISETIANFKNATGQEPAIIGVDLACYGLRLMDVDENTKSSYICDLVDYASRGGVITASSHFDNPGDPQKEVRGKIIGDKTGTLSEYEAAFEELLTEGSELNSFWKAELLENARFLKALGDQGVSVIWRPLHESNGSWFWFCTTQSGYTLDSSYLKRMWIYIYELYTNELGLENLIWCYGPNVSSNVEEKPGGTMSPWYCYPGDEYVDMVGVDWYTSGNYEIEANDNYKTLLEKTNKIGAITEFGPSGSILAEKGQNQEELFNGADLEKLLEKLQSDGLRITYLLTWTSKWSIPAMGRGNELMESDLALGLSDMAELLK